MFSFSEYGFSDYIITLIDVLVVWFIFYRLLAVIRGTKAIQLLKGFLVIIIVKFISNYFHLMLLDIITSELIKWGFLSIIIIFQPELRNAIAELGRTNFFKLSNQNTSTQTEKDIYEILSSVSYLAKRRIGALITIERETGLKEFIDTGIRIKSTITSQLLINIFIPNTPLHDGAVIIADNKIAAAACYLPLTESQKISKTLGTRHRAAIGISETNDSVTIVVSEETGSISLTKSGILHHDLAPDNLESMLKLALIKVENKSSSSFFKRGFKKHG